MDFNIDLGLRIKNFVKGVKKATDSTRSLGDGFKDASASINKVDKAFKGLGQNSLIVTELDKKTNGWASKFIDFAGNIRESLGGIKVSLKGVVSGLGLVRAALAATGIGLLVIAVGLLVAYWDDIEGAVRGVSSELKAQAKDLDKQEKAQKYTLDLLNSQDNTLKLQGKSQRQINMLKIGELETLLAIKKAQIQNIKDSLKGARAQQKTYKEIITTIVTAVTLAAESLGNLLQPLADLFGIDLKAGIEKARQAIISFAVPDLGITEFEKELKDANLEVVKLQNNIDGLKLANKKIDAGNFVREQLQPIVDTVSNRVKPINIPIKITVDPKSIQDSTKTTLTAVQESALLFAAKAEEARMSMSQTLTQGATDAIGNLAQGLGAALASGANVLQALGGVLLTSIGDISIQLGKQAIAIGVGLIAIQKAFSNPFTAIAAGVALVAIGSLIKGTAATVGQVGGGGGGGAAASSGGGVRNVSSISGGSNTGGAANVVFQIAGDKLIGVINNTLAAENRIGGVNAG